MKPIIAGLCAALSLWTAPAAQAQQPQDEDAIAAALGAARAEFDAALAAALGGVTP